MSRHVHAFRIMAFLDPSVFEWCDCGHQRIRKTTLAERRALRKEGWRTEKDAARIHKVNWAFNKEFRTGRRWNWTGPELMDRIERWARRHPRDVIVVDVSDRTFARSILVFILHRDGRHLWGVTVLGVTPGEEPFELFLYPDQAAALRTAFQSMKKLKPLSSDSGNAIRRVSGTLPR